MRYSPQRDTVYDILKGTKSHPDAEWVYAECQKRIPNISLGTVYRNLKTLAACGLIETLETERQVVHYDADISEHAHFICQQCGRIIDIFDFGSLKSQLEAEGYEVDSQKMLFYGICRDCAVKKSL